MPKITEQAAQRYAAAVYGVLVDASLVKRTLRPIVLEQVARQAEAPMASFELIVSDLPSANWRLMPNIDDRWRVCIGCFKLHPTSRDDALEDSVNRALGNIPLRVRCRNCGEPIADASDDRDPEAEWTHLGSTQSWRCRDDSGNHAEPEED